MIWWRSPFVNGITSKCEADSLVLSQFCLNASEYFHGTGPGRAERGKESYQGWCFIEWCGQPGFSESQGVHPWSVCLSITVVTSRLFSILWRLRSWRPCVFCAKCLKFRLTTPATKTNLITLTRPSALGMSDPIWGPLIYIFVDEKKKCEG